MDLIAQGLIQANLIQLNVDLMDIFDLYWVKVMGVEKTGSPILPFYHLKGDKFWHLVPVPGMESTLTLVRHIRSIGQLQALVIGARLDDQLFELLLKDHERDALRRVLIETYFAPPVRPKLVEVGHITGESFQYSLELRDRLRGKFILKEAPEVDEKYHAEARSAAFRRIVVEAYDHTCAICQVRLVTPEGRTAVAAAHIVPWSLSHNDDPRNGMSLCGLHHWSFDQGLLGIASDYAVLTSPLVPETQKPALLASERRLYLPKDDLLKPAQQALNWHRQHIFRAELPGRLLYQE
jgi:putative restriction endonuclease